MSISIPILKPSHFRPPDTKQTIPIHVKLNQVNFDPNTKTKSFSTPRHKINQFRYRTYFDPHTKTKLISIQRLKPNHFRPPYHNQVNSDPYTERNQVKFNPPQQNQLNFVHPHKNEVKFDAHTKTKLCSASIQKPSHFYIQNPSQL